MSKQRILVTQIVEIEVDDAKFTPEFLAEFRKSFYQFDDISDHRKHLGQLFARGIICGFGDEFIEGYGAAKDFGIFCREISYEVEEP